MKKPLDVSTMTLGWVNSTEDILLRDLERSERHLLYLVFDRDMDLEGGCRQLCVLNPVMVRSEAQRLSKVRRHHRQVSTA